MEETENTATIQAAGTVTVNPRQGSQDKPPWKGLDLTAITGQTVEAQHVFDVHLGETLAPYVTLDPLKAVLPLKSGSYEIPRDKNGVGGIRLGGLERQMRARWQTVSRLWDYNKAKANKLKLLGQLDYYGKLSAQLGWQEDPGGRPVRVVQTEAGQPTAALLLTDEDLVDSTLYWITCKSIDEANYLMAIINSEMLYESVQSLMPKGQFGARHLHKHLWKLAIPAFDAKNALHRRCGQGWQGCGLRRCPAACQAAEGAWRRGRHGCQTGTAGMAQAVQAGQSRGGRRKQAAGG